MNVAVSIGATPQQVWDYVKDISTHTEWMADAEQITFVTDQRAGVGTAFDCLTKVGPIRLNDRMTITRWEPERAMGVRHEGIVTGEGVFELQPVGSNRTVFSWTESLDFPITLGGPVGAVVARPILGAIWRRNLKRLCSQIEAKPPKQ